MDYKMQKFLMLNENKNKQNMYKCKKAPPLGGA